jgi:hypothetical protein
MSDQTTSVSNGEEQKCPCCHGTDLFAGRGSVFKVPFVPDTPILKYARSYLPSQYACLSCGFMGFVLQQSDLVKLRKENEARGT